MTSYSRFCYHIFGEYLAPLRKYFLDVREDLQLAGLNFTLDEYLSMAIFTSLLTFAIENIVFSFMFGLFLPVPVAMLLSLLLAMSFSGTVFFLFYSYPVTLAKKRGEEIDKVLPFAVSYMSAIASGKVSPYYLFRTLADFKEYGIVAEECRNIARNIKMFGMNVSDAIKREAMRTPSKNFRELLWGINTTLTTGGDIRLYLQEKANTLMAEYRRKIRKYSQDLSLFTEIYLTLIITGSIFFTVLTSLMAATAGLEIVLIQAMIAFLFLPLISSVFLILMKIRSPVK